MRDIRKLNEEFKQTFNELGIMDQAAELYKADIEKAHELYDQVKNMSKEELINVMPKPFGDEDRAYFETKDRKYLIGKYLEEKIGPNGKEEYLYHIKDFADFNESVNEAVQNWHGIIYQYDGQDRLKVLSFNPDNGTYEVVYWDGDKATLTDEQIHRFVCGPGLDESAPEVKLVGHYGNRGGNHKVEMIAIDVNEDGNPIADRVIVDDTQACTFIYKHGTDSDFGSSIQKIQVNNVTTFNDLVGTLVTDLCDEDQPINEDVMDSDIDLIDSWLTKLGFEDAQGPQGYVFMRKNGDSLERLVIDNNKLIYIKDGNKKEFPFSNSLEIEKAFRALTESVNEAKLDGNTIDFDKIGGAFNVYTDVNLFGDSISRVRIGCTSKGAQVVATKDLSDLDVNEAHRQTAKDEQLIAKDLEALTNKFEAELNDVLAKYGYKPAMEESLNEARIDGFDFDLENAGCGMELRVYDNNGNWNLCLDGYADNSSTKLDYVNDEIVGTKEDAHQAILNKRKEIAPDLAQAVQEFDSNIDTIMKAHGFHK